MGKTAAAKIRKALDDGDALFERIMAVKSLMDELERGNAAIHLLRDIIEDASKCESAGLLTVSEALIERAREIVGE